jgi:hypothetical protein
MSIESLKQNIKERCRTNLELQTALNNAGIKLSDIDTMTGEQIKTVLNPRMMAMMGVNKEDLENM